MNKSALNYLKIKNRSLERSKHHLSILFGILAHEFLPKENHKKIVGLIESKLEVGIIINIPESKPTFSQLDKALDGLSQINPLQKPRLLKASLAVMLYDDQYQPEEMEMMRALGEILDCPIPVGVGR